MNERSSKTLKLFLLRNASTPIADWVAEAEAMLTDEEWLYYQRQVKRRRKDPIAAWVLWGLLGVFGAHRFYIGDALLGVLYLISFGLLGFGVLADLFMLGEKVRQYNLKVSADVLNLILSARLRKSAGPNQ